MKSFLPSDFISSIGFNSITSSHSSSNDSQFNFKKFSNSPFFPLLIIFLVVVGAVILFKFITSPSDTTVAGLQTGEKIAKIKTFHSQEVNRTFTFHKKNTSDKDIAEFNYVVQKVELREQIATAAANKLFFVINLKITNNDTKTIMVNARDYIRLMINDAPEKFAADIHSDPVEIQPISTKYTTIAFPLEKVDTQYLLQVGEITGKKEMIALTL